MTKQNLASGCVAAAAAAFMMAAVAAVIEVPVAGQSQAAPSPTVAKAAAPKLAEPAKAGAKTAWGEPDLQGVWTSDAALGIPRERPEKFGNRASLTDEEF